MDTLKSKQQITSKGNYHIWKKRVIAKKKKKLPPEQSGLLSKHLGAQANKKGAAYHQNKCLLLLALAAISKLAQVAMQPAVWTGSGTGCG